MSIVNTLIERISARGNMLRPVYYVYIKQHRYIIEREGVHTSQASMESSRYTYIQQSQCTRK